MQRVPEPELMDLPDEARAYAAADFADVNAAFVARLLELTGDRERTLAVDLGTGPADIPQRVLRARPHWQILAVDAAAAMLELARTETERAGLVHAIRLVQAAATASGLPAATHDVVFSNSLLHHVVDVDGLWREVQRLLRPGGLVFVRDLLRPPTREQARALVERHAGDASELLKQEFYRSLLSAYTPDEVRAQLERSGLAQLQVRVVSDRHLDVFGTI